MYTNTLPYRLSRADCVIFLDVSRIRCLWRVIKRIICNYNQVLSTSAPGCHERFDRRCLEFFRWVWNFKTKSQTPILQFLELYKKETVVYHVQEKSELQAILTQFSWEK